MHLFLFFLLTSASPAFAFMNIESIRLANKEGTSGSLGLKLNGQSGNTEKLTSEFNTLTIERSDLNEYLLAGKYRYGESRRIKDTHDGNLHVRYTRYIVNWPAVETFAQTQFNEFKQLKRRDLLGVGLRTLLQRAEANSLYLGTGLFYEHEKFENRFPDEETVRANIYLSFVRTFNAQVSGSVIVYYQPSLEGFGDTRVQVDSGLQVNLAAKLALTLDYDIQYDSQPVPGVAKTDTIYLVGLAYAY